VGQLEMIAAAGANDIPVDDVRDFPIIIRWQKRKKKKKEKSYFLFYWYKSIGDDDDPLAATHKGKH
jgi:hypothetical protein